MFLATRLFPPAVTVARTHPISNWVKFLTELSGVQRFIIICFGANTRPRLLVTHTSRIIQPILRTPSTISVNFTPTCNAFVDLPTLRATPPDASTRTSVATRIQHASHFRRTFDLPAPRVGQRTVLTPAPEKRVNVTARTRAVVVTHSKLTPVAARLVAPAMCISKRLIAFHARRVHGRYVTESARPALILVTAAISRHRVTRPVLSTPRHATR